MYFQWTKDWRPETLKPTNTHFVQSIMEEEDVNWDYGEDGNVLITCLEIGNNFVVNVVVDNDEGQEFWLIRCSKPLHKVNKDFIDAWDSSYIEVW